MVRADGPERSDVNEGGRFRAKPEAFQFATLRVELSPALQSLTTIATRMAQYPLLPV